MFLLLVFVLLLWLLGAPVGSIAGNALLEDDGAAKADAIVVLGGDAFGTRILRAAELQKSGYAARIFVSGPANLLGHESDQTIEYAVRKGYPANLFEVIPLPADADSTRSEALVMARTLQAQGIHFVDLITSNYHTRRAARIWRKEVPDIRVNAVPAPDPYFSPETWFQSRRGQKTFFLEATKSVVSYFGY